METSKNLPIVFLDTNVIAAYLRGESPSSELFSPAVLKQVRLAINPVVLQELFLLTESSRNPEMLDELQEEVNIIPVNLQKAEEYLKYAANLRNRIAHSNDILVFSSAAECDYLVTYDKALSQALGYLSKSKPQVVTPEQLLSELGTKV